MSAPQESRRCSGCGAPLARDNTGSECALCQSTSRGGSSAAPDVPDWFWDHPSLQAAFGDRHMGKVIRAYRHHPWHGSRVGLPQEQVATWAGVQQAQISRIENRAPITEINWLTYWATLLKIPQQHLWFKLPPGDGPVGTSSPQTDRSTPSPTSTTADARETDERLGANSSGTVGASDVAVVREMLNAFTGSDRQFGGGHARTQATAYVRDVVLPRLRMHPDNNRVGRDMFAVSTEFALRVASMQLDGGRPQASRKLIRLAGSLADQLADNLALNAWVLARRGEQHLYEGHVGHGLAYTAAGAAMAKNASPTVRAFLTGKHALALAMTGDKPSTQDALGQVRDAFDKASGTVEHEETWVGNYGLGHLRHDEALCYAHLGMGAEAVAATEESLQAGGRARFARPRAFSLGVQAIGYAEAGDVDAACTVGHELVSVTTQLASHRVRARIVDVLNALADHRDLALVHTLHEAARPVLTTGTGQATTPS